MEIIIHDKRPEKEFNTTTFSNFKKSEAVKTFINAMNTQDIEASLFWCVELLCSGRLKDIWDCFLMTMGKYIRVGNPKLAVYIATRFDTFKQIMGNGYIDDELALRNSPDMRKLLGEIVLVLCFSPKKPSLLMLKINKKDDFSFENLGQRLKADNMEWCKKVIQPDDPPEILLGINEFTYHFYKKNLLYCCYWADWLIDFDSICRKQKKPIIIVGRDFTKVDTKFTGDPIWILWEVLLKEHKNKPSILKIIQSLFDLFCLRYNFSQKRKRKHLLYLAIELYTEKVDMSIAIIHKSDKIKLLLPQLPKFYRAIKKFEQCPNIISEKQRNLQNSIDKMKMVYEQF